MEDGLRAAGLRLTGPRRAIVFHLASAQVHPSARQVFQEVKKRYPRLSLATVYNTLGLLVQTGFIKRMEFQSLDNRYETNLAPHINLICTVCGRIQDLRAGWRPPLERLAQAGFQILDYRMEYYGVCRDCTAGKRGVHGGGDPLEATSGNAKRKRIGKPGDAKSR